jgi:hypothetical protein
MIDLSSRIRSYVDKLSPAISGARGHHVTLHAASVLVNGFGLEPDQAWPFMVQYNMRCEPQWNEQALRRKLSEALRTSDRPRGYLLGGRPISIGQPTSTYTPTQNPVYDPHKLAELAAKLPETVDVAYLESRSKFSCWNRSPAGFLHKLYRPGERIIIFTHSQSQGAAVWEHPGIAGGLSSLNEFTQNSELGVWFLCQPVTGEFAQLDRLKSETNPKGRSRRCEECVTAWRYAVIESDEAPTDQWLKALVQWPIPIAAIYTSGGRSIHALVRVDASSKQDWDRIIRDNLKPAIVPYGADPGAMTGIRLTRLPGCMREEKGQLQQLLYLDDDPDGTPICRKPVRSVTTIFEVSEDVY